MKFTIIKFGTIISVFLTFYFCHSPNFSSIKVKIVESFDKYNDSIYVNNVSDIAVIEDDIFIVDNSVKSIIVMDSNFVYKNKFGNFGRGPAEYYSCINIENQNNHLFVSDYIGNSVFIYDKESLEFLKKIKYPEKIRIPPGEFAVDKRNNFYGQSLNESYYIASYNDTDQKIVFLGRKGKNSIDYRYKELVIFQDDFILGIPFYSDVITLFSIKDPDFVKHIKVPLPKDVLNKWSEFKKQSEGKTPIILDVQVIDDFIYICYQNFGKNKVVQKIHLNENFDVSVFKQFHLKDKNGDKTFCIYDERIVTYAFGSRAIQVYEK